jgi:hypothetical protein
LVQTFFCFPKDGAAWARPFSSVKYRDNPASFFDERWAVLFGSFTSTRTPALGYAMGQFLKYDVAERNGGFQPVRVNGRRFGRITNFYQRKRREQTLAKSSSQSSVRAIPVTPCREVVGFWAAKAVVEICDLPDPKRPLVSSDRPTGLWRR